MTTTHTTTDPIHTIPDAIAALGTAARYYSIVLTYAHGDEYAASGYQDSHTAVHDVAREVGCYDPDWIAVYVTGHDLIGDEVVRVRVR